jgi:predicted PurR-regulated permease PerM
MPDSQSPSAGQVHADSTRLQSILILLIGIGLFLALPFILSAGASFFLPIAAAMVMSIMLSPLADAFDRAGLPNALGSFVAIAVLVVGLILAFLLILQPAADLGAQLPALMKHVAGHVERVQGGFSGLSDVMAQLARLTGQSGKREVILAGPSMIEQVAFATPTLVFESIVTMLMTYFLIESRVRMRRQLLLDRASFGASLRAARAMRDVQDRVVAYVSTVTLINMAVGLVVAVGAWALGLEAPVMWGGLATLLNFLPYVGPLAMVGLLGAVGLGTSETLLAGLLPAALYLALHSVEANLITPSILGKRFTINPVAILIAISYFSWIWGVLGALLSVPVLITLKALFDHLGRPNVIGFLLGEPLFEPVASETGETEG